MEVFEVEGSREKRLVIGYKRGGTTKFFRYVLRPLRPFSTSPIHLQRLVQSLSLLLALFREEIRRSVALLPPRSVRADQPTEQFSNGITIICLYLNPLPSVKDAPPIENSIHQIMKEASLLYCLPDNSFFAPGNGHAVQEATYACTSPSHTSPIQDAHRPQQTVVGFLPSTSVIVWGRPISLSKTYWMSRTLITQRS